jgi:two-component system sensor histidine kinase YesM
LKGTVYTVLFLFSGIKQYSLLSLLSIAAGLLLAWLMWRMVYVPLTQLSKEIRQLGNSRFHSEIKKTNIPEYDELLHQFWRTRKQVWELLLEVEQKEKRRADLEVEKLMYQINPHFLYNTLDTVSWIARLNGQDEIDKLVTSLNKLLHYNLGKQGQETTDVRQYSLIRSIFEAVVGGMELICPSSSRSTSCCRV